MQSSESDNEEPILVINEGGVLEVPTPPSPPITPPSSAAPVPPINSPVTPELIMRRSNSPEGRVQQQRYQQSQPSTPVTLPALSPLLALSPSSPSTPPAVAANEEVHHRSCLICHETDANVQGSCETCNAEIHQLCLDRLLLPRLERPTCPQCHSVLNNIEPQQVRQRMRTHQQEVVS